MDFRIITELALTFVTGFMNKDCNMMKTLRIFGTFVLMCVTTVLFFACKEEKNISFGKLPARAQSFIEQHFEGIAVESVIRDKDDGQKDYEVVLEDGTKIDFNEEGEWYDIECVFGNIPETVFPEAMNTHMKENYPEVRISEAERKVGGYVVKIIQDSKPLELYYDKDGAFINESVDY